MVPRVFLFWPKAMSTLLSSNLPNLGVVLLHRLQQLQVHRNPIELFNLRVAVAWPSIGIHLLGGSAIFYSHHETSGKRWGCWQQSSRIQLLQLINHTSCKCFNASSTVIHKLTRKMVIIPKKLAEVGFDPLPPYHRMSFNQSFPSSSAKLWALRTPTRSDSTLGLSTGEQQPHPHWARRATCHWLDSKKAFTFWGLQNHKNFTKVNMLPRRLHGSRMYRFQKWNPNGTQMEC